MAQARPSKSRFSWDFFRREDGAAYAEAATTLPSVVLIFFFFGSTIQICYTWAGLQYAVSKGLRSGISGSITNEQLAVPYYTDAQQTTQDVATKLGINNGMTLNVNALTVRGTLGNFMEVTASKQVAFWGLPSNNVTLNAYATGRLERTP